MRVYFTKAAAFAAFFILVTSIVTAQDVASVSSNDIATMHNSYLSSTNLNAPIPDSLQGWETNGLISITASQVSLTNWNSGGQGVVAANALFSLNIIHRGEKSIFENNINLAYGLQKFEKDGLRKSDDKIDIASKYGTEAFGNWYYTGLLNFRTQFQNGYNYPDDSTAISGFMAPGYLIGSIGLENKSFKGFSVLISPVTGKFTFVNDPRLSAAGAFGVDTGKTVRAELGGAIRIGFTKEWKEKISFTTKLDLFSNYLHNPQNIDVVWDNLLSFKVTKLLTTTINTSLIYDNDIIFTEDTNGDGVADKSGPRTQYKQVIGVGIQYSF